MPTAPHKNLISESQHSHNCEQRHTTVRSRCTTGSQSNTSGSYQSIPLPSHPDCDMKSKERRGSQMRYSSRMVPRLAAAVCFVGAFTWIRSDLRSDPIDEISYKTSPPKVKEEATVYLKRRKNIEQEVSQPKKQLKVFRPHPSILKQPDLDNGLDVMLESTASVDVEHLLFTLQQQRAFLEQYGSQCYTPSDSSPILEQWDIFGSAKPNPLVTLQIELWKYCSLYIHGGLYLEAEAMLLQPIVNAITAQDKNIAVFSSVYSDTVHGGLMYITQPKESAVQYMLSVLMETDVNLLVRDPLYVSKMAHKAVTSSTSGWMLWRQSCHLDAVPVHPTTTLDATESFGNTRVSQVLGPIGSQVFVPKYHRLVFFNILSNYYPQFLVFTCVTFFYLYRLLEQCPTAGEYCCSTVQNEGFGLPLALSRHPISPFRAIPQLSDLPKTFSFDKKFKNGDTLYFTKSDRDNLPYISTIREKIYAKPKTYPDTPTFYEILHKNDCVPSDRSCSDCLRNKKGSSCSSCENECSCFCKTLCKTRPPAKFVRKSIFVHPPLYAREVDRIVPRIIHQTWFEPVTRQKYPNMSRLIESWKQAGWEYRFYDDSAIETFLRTHFPKEIFEAYDALIPGAFKADLFRYCVLLIYGGVYADMDVLLESNLEVSVPPDVGFMTPLDEPGKAVNKRMCLWNGLIAVAPAHPFMARTIENVVNAIRNRFTSVDSDNRLCDTNAKPELSISHAWDTLFTAGPCIMGQSINEVLERDQQHTYEPGQLAESGKIVNTGKTYTAQLPGRSVILSQNKEDMGAHRFTLLEANLVVAATDMPDYDDRQYTPKVVDEDSDEDEDDSSEKPSGGGAHYSETHVKVGVYGLTGLYKNPTSADEDIKIIIVPPS